MVAKRIALILLVVALGIGIFHAPIMRAVTASFDMTVRVVDSAGNVLNGTASATSASFDRTVRVVDSTGKVLDSFGGVAGSYPSGSPPQLGGFSAANVPEAETVSGAGDCGTIVFSRSGANAYTMTSTCLSSNGNLFTSSAFGSALTGLSASAVTSGTLATARIATIASGLTGVLPLANGGTNQATGATSFCMGTSATIAAATTDFIACGDDAAVALLTTEANAQQMIPTACTASNLQVTLTTAANTNKPVITVDKNAVGTTLTCTVNDGVGADTTTHCEDTTHTFTTTGTAGAKDLLSIKVANPASANATGVMQVSFNLNC